MTVEKPLPSPDPVTAPYWNAAAERRFVLPRCEDCGRHHFYPRSVCPHCGSSQLAWVEVSGRGEVYSYTVIHRAPSAAFAPDVPYAVALIALEEGPHLMSHVVGCAPGEVRIGLPVQVDFRDAGDGVLLPVFAPR